MTTGTPPGVAALLALSDERDQWQARLLADTRDAYARGRDDGHLAGYLDGYHAAEQAMEQAWAAVAIPVSRGRHPVADGWELRLRAAEAYVRRTALDWWDGYLRRARAENPARRTQAQCALLELTETETAP